MKKVILGLSSLILLSACQTHTVRLGTNIYEKTNPGEIFVHYDMMPKCDYEEIGILDNPHPYSFHFKWMWDLDKSVEQMKQDASFLGADFIVLKKWHKNGGNNKMIDVAVAYKCKNKK